MAIPNFQAQFAQSVNTGAGLGQALMKADEDLKKSYLQDIVMLSSFDEQTQNAALPELFQKYASDPMMTKSLESFQKADYETRMKQNLMAISSMTGKPIPGEKKSDFAPQISPVQKDPETGQKYIIKTDRNTGEATRVDVEGAIGQSSSEEEQGKIRLELLKDAKEEAKNAFSSLRAVKKSIGTIDEAISAIDKGANTGVIDQYLPSFKEATIELENAANRMGLDVISATTFGALSEGELRLAMNTAMPRNLEPKELKDWLVKRKKSQQKLARELNKMAITLGKGKTTIAEYLESNATFGEQSKDSEDSNVVNWSDI